MANRSYLFAASQVPETFFDRPEFIWGLSEWAYDLPLAYQLLVSDNTRACASLSFKPMDAANPPLAIAGSAAGGLARLTKLLDLLARSPAGEAHAEFMAACSETKRFLDENTDNYFYLETAELDCMGTEVLHEAIDGHLASIRHFAALVDQLTPGNIEAHIAPGGALEGVMSELGRFEERALPTLGIANWTNVLYLAPRDKEDFDPADYSDDADQDDTPVIAPIPPHAEPLSGAGPKGSFWSRLFKRRS